MFRFWRNQIQNQHQYRPYHMYFSHFPNRNPTPPPTGIGSQILEKMSTSNLNIESILTSIQKFLGMAEQITPLIQQYGPLIKSAPALLQLLKETEENHDDGSDNDENRSSNSVGDKEDNDKSKTESEQNDTHHHKSNKKKKTRRSETPKESVPKLYI